jgi:hypothetical protein
MSRVRIQKTNFTAGEVSPRLLGRSDLRSYENGAAKLRNVFIHPTGGLSRRAGLRYVDSVPGPGRLISFEFNTEQVYLLVFTDGTVGVYRTGIKVAEFATPWTEDHLRQINWTQSADTLLVVHPDIPPKKITRTSESEWRISDWVFSEVNGRIYQPHHKFAGDDVTVQASGITGQITVTASEDVFVPDHSGTRLRIADKEVKIISVLSARTVRANVNQSLVSTSQTKDWEEQAFSPVHGWPVSVTFHQDRLVIGGSRDLPNRLWLSKSADLFNFNLGTGLDDEAIEFSILSDQVNAVRAIFSGRHLQVFTSGAEWMVAGAPLTPSSIELHRQTRVGSPIDRIVPPRDVDGATLFVPRTGEQLREFLFTDVEQAYQATDLAVLAEHLIVSPVDMDFDKSSRLFHVVMGSGTLATLTVYRAEQVSAWTLQETAGAFRAVVTVGNETYVMVERSGSMSIEVFDSGFGVDSGLAGTSSTAKSSWSGLDHLEGQTVKILADGAVRIDGQVENGAVFVGEPATSVQVGLGYVHNIQPLPPSAPSIGGSEGRKVRPIAITFRLWETAALHLDTGRGLVDVPFKRFGNTLLDAPLSGFRGDKTVRALGWRSDDPSPLWRIEQDTPLPFTLLSVSTEMSVNV